MASMMSGPKSAAVSSAANPRSAKLHIGPGIFKITRLHSNEGSVDVVTQEPVAAPKADEPAPQQAEAKADVARAPTPDRRSLQQRAGRPLFFANERSLQYLDGSLPGDYGWDPLGLAAPRRLPDGKEDPTMNLKWLSYAEVVHGRWAMLAAAGAIAPEVLARSGVIPEATGLPWFVAGGLYPAEGASVAVPFFGKIPFSYWVDQYTLFWTMMVAMGFAEFRRLQDYRNPGSMKKQYFLGLESVLGGSGDAKYPGGQFFNIANLGKTDKEMFELKTKEVKNGRLAMVAFLGFMVQAQTTGRGPIENIFDHIANPSSENILARVGQFAAQSSAAEKTPFLIWLLAGFAAGAVLTDSETAETSKAAEKN